MNQKCQSLSVYVRQQNKLKYLNASRATIFSSTYLFVKIWVQLFTRCIAVSKHEWLEKKYDCTVMTPNSTAAEKIPVLYLAWLVLKWPKFSIRLLIIILVPILGTLVFYLSKFKGLTFVEMVRRRNEIAAISVCGPGTQTSYPNVAKLPPALFDPPGVNSCPPRSPKPDTTIVHRRRKRVGGE